MKAKDRIAPKSKRMKLDIDDQLSKFQLDSAVKTQPDSKMREQVPVETKTPSKGRNRKRKEAASPFNA